MNFGTQMKVKLMVLVALTLFLEVGLNFYHTFSAKFAAFEYFSEMLVHSTFVICMKSAILVFTFIVRAYINEYKEKTQVKAMLLIVTSVFFMQILVASNHFIVLYVALEGVSLLLFILAAIPKSENSIEAGIKYYLQGSVASAILLMGIALLYISTRDFQFNFIRVELLEEPISELTGVSFLLIGIALLFKVSAFPGHMWAVDVYRGPIVSVLNFFAVVVKLAMFFVIMQVQMNLLAHVYSVINTLFFVSSIASMIIGLIGTLKVINSAGSLREFIAYTSINQVGFVLLGLTCMSIDGLVASLVYLVTYLLASSLFIGVISRFNIVNREKGTVRDVETLSDLRIIYLNGLPGGRRLDLWLLAISIWSMAGLPPLAGFVGKFAI
jgi:NADH-quinone oxidoreductase subunit N